MSAGKGEIDEHDLGALIAHFISSATTFDESEFASARTRAIEYLRGEMNDTPSRPNGSSVTSRDLADVVSWTLPGIMSVFMASDRMAEYEPVAPDVSDPGAIKKAEENAEQASDYVSYCFMKDNEGYRIVYSASHDGLNLGNGIVKHWWDATPETKISHHTRLTAEQVTQLVTPKEWEKDGEVKVLAGEKNPEPDMVMDEMGQPSPVETYNVKIERVTSRGRLRCQAIPREDFLKDADAITIDDAQFVAHHDRTMTRSRLIEMGFDREKVDALPGGVFLTNDETLARRSQNVLPSNDLIKSMQIIDYYECYLKIDADGDGVAEWCKIDYAGSGGAGEILNWEVWEDDIPFSDIPCYPQPHRFEAESMADRTMDIQQVKTVLKRGMLDNVYASGMPMREVEEGSVLNPDALVSPKFGGIIWKKKQSLPIVPHEMPFVAEKLLVAMEYLDRELEKRTGVTQMSMALDPETLQNQSATANQNAHDASYTQKELIARNMAELGWRRVFRALLKLIVKHQDRPRTIRLRGKFVEMDPRQWDADMDVTVNTGLGTGSRDRDMAMLQMVAGSQVALAERLAAAGEHAEAIDMIPRIISTFKKSAESAGLRNPDQYYPDFDEQKLQAMKQGAAEKAKQPPIEIQLEQAKGQTAARLEQTKAQTSLQLQQGELQVQAQSEQIKAEGNKVKEAAQLEGDLQKAAADREMQREAKLMDMQIKREEIASRERIAMAQMQQQAQTESQKLGLEGQKVGLDGKRLELDQSEREPVVSSNKGFAEAIKALTDAVGLVTKPKRVVRDPKTNAVIGVETVQ